MSTYLSYNGKLLPADQPVPENRGGFAAGDGVFETMRITHGKIILGDYHFERLLSGIQAMRLEEAIPNKVRWEESIIELCSRNDHYEGARVRFTVFRKPDGAAEWVIESWKLDGGYTFDEEGFTTGIFSGTQKSLNALSPFKTVNYQPYRAAAAFAAGKQWDDCLVLNASGNVCDSSISNVFWISNKVVYTPPLSEGCIDGVMRRYLLQALPANGFYLEERLLAVKDLSAANEVFLTNVIRGIRSVKRFENISYEQELSRQIFTLLVPPLTNL